MLDSLGDVGIGVDFKWGASDDFDVAFGVVPRDFVESRSAHFAPRGNFGNNFVQASFVVYRIENFGGEFGGCDVLVGVGKWARNGFWTDAV